MDAKQLPKLPSVERFRKQARDLLKGRRSISAVRRIKRHHPRFAKFPEAEVADGKLSLSDAQLVIAREHAFKNWPEFVKHIRELVRTGSPVWRFESAADAIVAGKVKALRRLLRDDPELVRARSTRLHAAPLIHYVAANGVEDFRQKTPKNIVEIARVLLAAGTEVDAATQEYGGASTALGLAATSCHPAEAGVQRELLRVLLDAGACVDGAPGGWNPLVAALHNGRGEAATYLAGRGARLDLEGAAGTGRVDLVARYIDQDGQLKGGATNKQLNYGFIWACEYGHANVVSFLLDRGFKPTVTVNHGETGLHWAALGGQTEIVDLLLKANAPVNAKELSYGGTPLGWAVYGCDHSPCYYEVVERLTRAGATVDWEWIESRGGAFAGKVRADSRMMAALGAPRKSRI
jgi:hypothetical protein